MIIEIFSIIAVLWTLFIIVEKIWKVPFLVISVLWAVIWIMSYHYYWINNFANWILIISFVSYFLWGWKIPKL